MMKKHPKGDSDAKQAEKIMLDQSIGIEKLHCGKHGRNA